MIGVIVVTRSPEQSISDMLLKLRINSAPCRISTGRSGDLLTKPGQIGFTLIELIVVMALLSLTLAIAMPRLQDFLLVDHARKAGRWIILQVPSLKDRAVREQKTYRMHIDIDTARIWISDETMDEDQLLEAASRGFELTGRLEVLDVEYPNAEKISSGTAEIRFHPRGYSDRAIIHLRDDEDRFSFQVEPFLSNVIMFEDYISF